MPNVSPRREREGDEIETFWEEPCKEICYDKRRGNEAQFS